MFHVNPSIGCGDRPDLRILAVDVAHQGFPAISYLHPLLAIVVGLFHAAIAPVIVVAGVKPNLVLVAVVLVTVLLGFLPGITWAFVAGLTANLLVGDPLGSVPLLMLLVAALVAGGARLLGRVVWVYPVIAVFAASIVADLGALAISQLVADAPMPAVLPTEIILAAAVLNAAVAAVLLVPARLLVVRYAPDDAPAW
jgi:rod shape-determining protein MreD